MENRFPEIPPIDQIDYRKVVKERCIVGNCPELCDFIQLDYNSRCACVRKSFASQGNDILKHVPKPTPIQDQYERCEKCGESALTHSTLCKKEPIQDEEAIPKMPDELAALSDVAAIDYGKQWGVNQLSPDYDTGADITDAFEAGLNWLYRRVMQEMPGSENPIASYWFEKARQNLVERNDFKGQLSAANARKKELTHLKEWEERTSIELAGKLADANAKIAELQSVIDHLHKH